MDAEDQYVPVCGWINFYLVVVLCLVLDFPEKGSADPPSRDALALG